MTDEVVIPQADTAFLVYREDDGSWTATTEIDKALLIRREATGLDVKTGCREIFETFAQNDLAFAISSLIVEKSSKQEQTTADAIRDALHGRNITNL